MPRMSMSACFYLILAVLHYFNQSSVFILLNFMSGPVGVFDTVHKIA